jgi:hypothetical protein
MTTDRFAALPRPPNQARFLEVVELGRSVYRAGRNELEQGSARPARAKTLCATFSRLDVNGWTGFLSKLSTNNDGRGVIAVEVGKDIYVKTWGNALSDTGDKTLLDSGSDLYRKLFNFKTGQAVAFSGQFIKDSTGTDCLRESSMTMNGSMTSPEFIFRFYDVIPVN